LNKNQQYHYCRKGNDKKNETSTKKADTEKEVRPCINSFVIHNTNEMYFKKKKRINA